MLESLKKTYRTSFIGEACFRLSCSIWRDYPGRAGEMIRRRIYRDRLARAGDGFVIYQGVRLAAVGGIELCEGAEVGVDNILDGAGGIRVGRNSILGPGVEIRTRNERPDPADGDRDDRIPEYEAVEIGDDCWLGADVTVLPGVHLPDGCVISAGSRVGKKDYPPFAVIAGAPARTIGSRNTLSRKNLDAP